MAKRVSSKRIRQISALAALIIVLGFVLPATQIVNAASPVKIPAKVSFGGNSLPTETFTVELSEGSLQAAETKSVTLSNGTKSGTVEFSLSGLDIGIYEYTLKQRTGSTPDVEYDQKEYTYYVMVNKDGTVEQRAINKADTSDKPSSVEFVNKYNASSEDEATGDPPVKIRKSISGDKPPKKDEFTFVMTPNGNTAGLDENPLPAGYGSGPVEVVVRGEGEVEIGNITFKKEGVYKYKVTEKDEKVEGYYYDDAVFDVTYTVTRNAATGKLECDREIIKNNSEAVSGSCVFNNIHESDGISTITKITQAVKTGDPGVMIPLTAFCLAIIALVTLIAVRRYEKEVGRGK